jgi:hypothetical protein
MLVASRQDVLVNNVDNVRILMTNSYVLRQIQFQPRACLPSLYPGKLNAGITCPA